MRRISMGLRVVPALCLAAACSSGVVLPSAAPAPAEATYVFRGSIVARGSSTVDELPAGAGTYRVIVDETFYQEGVFTDQTGREITVTAPDTSLPRGSGYVFYTQPYLFGSSVAVRLVMITRDSLGGRRIAERQAAAREWATVGERVRQAELIVLGRVVAVGAAEESLRGGSEHDPELRNATLRVERVLAGDPAGAEVTFLFAGSMDVHWYDAPKPAPGDEGIFLLNADAEGLAARRLTLFHALDFQPRAREAVVRQFLGLRNR